MDSRVENNLQIANRKPQLDPSAFHLLRTIFYLIPAISVYTIVLGSLSIGSSLFEPTGRFAHACARLWSRLILATTGVRVTVTGVERLTPGQTYVFVSNHQSIYDIPVLFWSLPFQLRIIAKDSLGRFPFLGWHLRRTGHMLVDRKNPDRAGILRRATWLARDGLSLIVFPEGTRSTDGTVGRFKGGSFLLALEAGLPIVPISVDGTRFVMRKGRLETRPGCATVTIHEPIPLHPHPRDERLIHAAKALADRVRDVVRSSVPGPVTS